MTPYKPCPYRFKYRYRIVDGEREGTCQDWEIEATFFHWAREYGEAKALAEMVRVFGEEYPSGYVTRDGERTPFIQTPG